MNLQRLILLIGAAVLIAGVVGLFVPVSVSGSNGESVGCGNAVASDLSAAQSADNQSGANVPVLSQFIPHTNFVAQCNSALSTRRAWSIPLTVIGVLAVAGAFFVGSRGRPRAAM